MTPFQPKKSPVRPGLAAPEPIDKPPVRTPPPAEGPPAETGSGVSLDMLDYRGSDKHCESCSHFDGESACDLDAATPVEPTGGCRAHSGGETEGQPEPDADDLSEGMPSA